MQKASGKSNPYKLKRVIGKLSRFKRDQRGVTAVEFALVSGPFFLLLFAIIEVSLYFFASQLLESSVDNVTRKIRTGQLTHITTKSDFKAELCKEIPALIKCDADLKVDVQVATSFDSFEATPEVDEDGDFDDDDFDYVNAGPRQIIKVTAIYKWPIFTNYAAPLVTNNLSDKALIISSAVVRTEPFE